MKIVNPLNSVEILSWNKKATRSEEFKAMYYVNGSWYFNKTTTFFSFEEESFGFIEINGDNINIMLSTKFV